MRSPRSHMNADLLTRRADGSRSIVFSHTMHIALLPALADVALPYNNSFASFPNTPYEGATPHDSPRAHHSSLPRHYDRSGHATPANFHTHPPATQSRLHWPIASVIAALHPRSIIATLTTIHLRVITTLRFNEAGRIVHHEDTWGLKEVVEGLVPIAGRLYWLQRKAIGTAASTLAKALGLTRTPGEASPPAMHPTAMQQQSGKLSAGLGLVDMDVDHGKNGHL